MADYWWLIVADGDRHSSEWLITMVHMFNEWQMMVNMPVVMMATGDGNEPET